MAESTVVRNTPTMAAQRCEVGRPALDGFRARHACDDGGQWFGPARPDEGAAWSDGIRHERVCADVMRLPKGEPCQDHTAVS